MVRLSEKGIAAALPVVSPNIAAVIIGTVRYFMSFTPLR
jgi:hypothetical protein